MPTNASEFLTVITSEINRLSDTCAYCHVCAARYTTLHKPVCNLAITHQHIARKCYARKERLQAFIGLSTSVGHVLTWPEYARMRIRHLTGFHSMADMEAWAIEYFGVAEAQVHNDGDVYLLDAPDTDGYANTDELTEFANWVAENYGGFDD